MPFTAETYLRLALILFPFGFLGAAVHYYFDIMRHLKWPELEDCLFWFVISVAMGMFIALGWPLILAAVLPTLGLRYGLLPLLRRYFP